MKIFHNSDHGRHDNQREMHEGTFVRSFECPERMDAILAALAAAGFEAPEEPAPLPLDVLHRVHDADYVRFLETAHDRWVAEYGEGEAIPFCWPVHGLFRGPVPEEIEGALGHYNFSVDTVIGAGTWTAAVGAAAAAHAAAGHVAGGGGPAFALGRPPGHHAHADLYGGYCYLNNAAIAAETLRAAGAGRVAVLDIDYHHGNGTQAIFWERADVLFLSLHADPVQEFPFFSGHAGERGAGAGLGATVNFPMRHGTGFELWSAALEEACGRIADDGVDALVVSLGVDTYEGDPISRFALGTGHFPRIGRRLAALGLPTCFVMEGGYAVGALGDNVAGVLGGFRGT